MPIIESLNESSSLQRGGLNHQAIEDYLKTIYSLAQEQSPVSTSRIATAREVKPASATGMIKRLVNLDLVNYEKYYGVTLTEAGEKIALEVVRHHRLIELYLVEMLGYSWDEVHEEADILEHVISEKLEERIAAVLGNPEFGPHGNPIPTKDGTIAPLDGIQLTTMSVGESGKVSYIHGDDDGELLRYLDSIQLQLDASFSVMAIAPFDGPVTLKIGAEEVVVGHKVASAVFAVT